MWASPAGALLSGEGCDHGHRQVPRGKPQGPLGLCFGSFYGFTGRNVPRIPGPPREAELPLLAASLRLGAQTPPGFVFAVLSSTRLLSTYCSRLPRPLRGADMLGSGRNGCFSGHVEVTLGTRMSQGLFYWRCPSPTLSSAL